MEVNNENIYSKIQEILGKIPENFSILEEEIDVDLQMEYFEFSKAQKEGLNKEEVLKNKDELFGNRYTIFQKKK